MSPEERIQLVRRNTDEIVTEKEFDNILKKDKPSVYCGYEPNGPMHLGHFVTIIKLMDLQKAGFHIKILLADVHAVLNRKGSEDEIAKEVERWRKTIQAIGCEAEVVLGSTFQFEKSYTMDVMALSQSSTINRGLRSMQEIARDVDNATISQLLYPLMQVVDIKALNVDVALGGMEQRKIHMMGRDMSKTLKHSFIAFHTPLITSLKGPGEKMSKSIEGSGISVTDSESLSETLPMSIADNPILQIARLVVFPKFDFVKIERPEKFGGNIEIKNADELENIYREGKLHPLDLKNMVSKYLEEIIQPIRDAYNSL